MGERTKLWQVDLPWPEVMASMDAVAILLKEEAAVMGAMFVFSPISFDV